MLESESLEKEAFTYSSVPSISANRPLPGPKRVKRFPVYEGTQSPVINKLQQVYTKKPVPKPRKNGMS